jgi:hypothetical protein
MAVFIQPHNASFDVNQKPVQYELNGAMPTSWSSSNPAAVSIDAKGVATAVGAGVAVIKATYEDATGQHEVTTRAHSGNLLIYGADGTLYEVPPSVWQARPISPIKEPNIPSFELMTTNTIQGVYINPPDKPPSEVFIIYVCYVLDLAAIPLPPPDWKK